MLILLPWFSFADDGLVEERDRAAILHGIRIKGALTDRGLRGYMAGDDYPTANTTDSAGNIYVTGYTEGTFPGQTALGAEDCFLAKYNSSGVQQWAIQFGTSGSDICFGVALDYASPPGVHIAGYTNGTFAGQVKLGQIDMFAGVFASDTGLKTWIVQLGTPQDDYAYGVACDSSNRTYITGSTRGSLPGFTNLGNSDAYLISLNTTGTVRWTRQFGTNKDEEALALGFDSRNRFFPVGYTQGTFAGQTYFGSIDAWAARYNANGNQNWVSQFGTSAADQAIGVAAVSSSGITNIIGVTTGAFPGFTNSGGPDYFVVRKALAGTNVFTIQDGTSASDLATAVCVDSSGNPYVAGRTKGSFPGFSNLGQSDIWISKYSTTGVLSWRQQVGTTGDDTLNGMACTTTGINYPTGSSSGAYPGQTNLGAEDAVLMQFSTNGVLNWTMQFGTAN